MSKYITLDEKRQRLAECKSLIAALNEQNRGRSFSENDREEWNELNEEREELESTITEQEARDRVVESLADSKSATESGATFNTPSTRMVRGEDIYDLSTVRVAFGAPEVTQRDLHDRAKQAVETAHFPSEFITDESARDHIAGLLSKDDEQGSIAAHLLRTGSPGYKQAFAKGLTQGTDSLNQDEKRALSTGGTAGGYAVPFTTDPTVIPTSNFSVNPYRAIASVEQITTTTWHGVSSDGVTAQYASEAAEASDNSPQFAQPSITPNRAQVFIPFSYEIGQDWGAIQGELARLIGDAKDDLEAVRFTNGTAASSVNGVLTGGTAVVNTAATAAFGTVDVYSLEEALAPRFRPRASIVASRQIYNKVRQFDQYGGASVWYHDLQPGTTANAVPTPGNVNQRLLGYPAYECSSFSTSVSSANLIMTIGDFSYYKIIDRIGMGIELIPNLFGSNQRPTGQRGVFAFWRNGADVLSYKAFKTLKVL